MTNRIRILAIVAVITLASYIPTQAVTFDFDDLGTWSGPGAVGDYMSDLYGSEVSVRGTMVGPLFPPDPFGPDPYLFSTTEASDSALFPYSIDIGFDADNPIGSVSFEGAIFGDNPGHDFRLWAYTDGGQTLAGVLSWDTPVDDEAWWFDSGLITFDVPIDRLVFSDNWIYDVAIDDLSVAAWAENGGGISAPVPASMGLGFLGLAIVGILVVLRNKVLGNFAQAG